MKSCKLLLTILCLVSACCAQSATGVTDDQLKQAAQLALAAQSSAQEAATTLQEATLAAEAAQAAIKTKNVTLAATQLSRSQQNVEKIHAQLTQVQAASATVAAMLPAAPSEADRTKSETLRSLLAQLTSAQATLQSAYDKAREQFSLATPAPVVASGCTGLNPSVSTEAVAFRYKNEWSAGTHLTQTITLNQACLQLQGHELLAANMDNVKTYLGGLNWVFNIDGFFERHHWFIARNMVQFRIAGALGASVSDKSPTNFAALAGVGADVKLGGSNAYTTYRANWVRIGGQNAVEMSAGLTFLFGK